jgi:hypothetical protein
MGLRAYEAAMRTPELDQWLPDPVVRTRHRRTADASADELWAAAESIRLRDTRTLGRLVRWRIPGTAQDQTFRRMFTAYPFTVLEEGEHYSISGMAGRIWTLARDYPRLDGAEAWRDWDEPNSARVLFAHWVEETPDGRSALVSEARVDAMSRRAALRLRSLWMVVGTFERVIGAEPLPLAVRRAEAG